MRRTVPPPARRPLVTVVIATYGRPDVLRCVLDAVRMQSEGRWRVIVVGDRTGPDTRQTVRSLKDSRIAFVNLPQRQGEQSLPNSVGMMLAETELIALLNHDDMWLPDHLSRATDVILGGDAEFYAGSAAFAHEVRTPPGEAQRPIFSERTPTRRELADAFTRPPFVFEPASSWVFTRDLFERVGPWRPAVQLHRLPIIDWVLRAWRAGARFHHDPEVTTLKINTHHTAPDGTQYQHPAFDHEATLNLIRAHGSDAMRQLVGADLSSAVSRWGLPPPRESKRQARLEAPGASLRFLATGTDPFDSAREEAGMERGSDMRHALNRRTQECLASTTELDDLVAHARAQLA